MKDEHREIEHHFDLFHPEIIRVLVSGGREYKDRAKVFEALDRLYEITNKIVIIHGNARGADTFAKEWAKKTGVTDEPYKADWTRHGRAAGPIRNSKMAKACIDFAVIFPGDVGTADMTQKCNETGIQTWIIK